MNHETLCAALLHDTVEDTAYTPGRAARASSATTIAPLVDGVTKLDKVKYGDAAAGRDRAQDGRRHVPRHPGAGDQAGRPAAQHAHAALPARAQAGAKSRETLEIFAPLAHRLGMNTIKWELEDLAFATLYPKRYDEIARMVSERAPRRDAVPAGGHRERLRRPARGQDQAPRSPGRPKHYYSVYQKMIARDVGFDDIYDLVGIRVLVDSRPRLLRGARHDPRAVEPGPRPVQGLHRDAEVQHVPVAAHDGHRPRGQAGGAADPHLGHAPPGRVRRGGALEVQGGGRRVRVPAARPKPASDMAWLRQLVDWQRETADPAEFLESLRFDLVAAEVYVFTPRGQVIALPQGARRSTSPTPSTPRSATAASAPGSTAGWCRWSRGSSNGDTVEIFTSKSPDAGPARDWLKFVKSRAAPATRSGSGSPRSAARPRSRRARRRSPGPCASRACRCSGWCPARRCWPSPATCATPTCPRSTRPSARATSAPRRWCRSWCTSVGRGGRRARRTSPRPRCRPGCAAAPRRRRRGRRGGGQRRRVGTAVHAAAPRCPATRSSASSPAATACPCTAPTAPTWTSSTREPDRLVEVRWSPADDSRVPGRHPGRGARPAPPAVRRHPDPVRPARQHPVARRSRRPGTGWRSASSPSRWATPSTWATSCKAVRGIHGRLRRLPGQRRRLLIGRP